MTIRLRKILTRIARILLRFGLLLLGLVILLEVFYRYQLVDTYRREWNHLNPELPPSGDGTPILVMGDSFSAAPDNWVDQLRRLRPDLQIYNAAVPGTGVRQANFMARRRFKASQPRHFIYQIYVGNDLFDLRYPLNWKANGLARNLYWMLANRLRGIGWLNYALGQFQAAPPPPGNADGKSVSARFNPNLYSPRAVQYIKAEPGLIQESALLQGARGEDFEDYLEYLDDLLEYALDAECTISLLLIPHCAQVHPTYTRHMQALGAQIDDPKAILQAEYPFMEQLEEHYEGNVRVRVLNALPVLRGLEVDDTLAYYGNDIHLSPAGQRHLGEWVAGQLWQP